ncbi:MAG TPA: aldo/keto reductase [Kofleriaceae bacterium]|jgi:aryl-alcohol dehydrogenase-like predicted oxidoreductase
MAREPHGAAAGADPTAPARKSRLGLGLAALGRPGYITVGHARDLAGATEVAALEARCHEVLDAAWAAGIRWFDAARSYGRAEQFLASWIGGREGVTVSSKWGYRYTADWQTHAEQHEVKDHSLAALDRQYAESRALLGAHLELYQVHSVTPDSPILGDAAVLARLAELRDEGLAIGLSLSGPQQRETLERALALEPPIFSAVQATWNVLERAVEPALREAHARGWRVLVKEAMANGRLATDARLGEHPDATALAVALAQPFVDVVLSGAVTAAQLASNARAINLRVTDDFASLVEPPAQYWAERARLPWT